MHIQVSAVSGVFPHHEGFSWGITENGDLDIFTESGAVSCSYSRQGWYQVKRVLEPGEEYPPPVNYGEAMGEPPQSPVYPQAFSVGWRKE